MQRRQQKEVQVTPQLFDDSSFLPGDFPRISSLRPSHNLLAVFEDCHNYIYANEGLLKEKIFHEIVKLLLMKLADEQGSPDRRVRFAITADEYRDVQNRCSNGFVARMGSLFESVRGKYADLLGKDTGLTLAPLTLAYVVERLQPISLSATPGDVKGEAFQSFVYRHQRGDRGEYFTPHPIVRLAVKMVAPQPDERVIDPACGSGGFLIRTIAHVAEAMGPSARRWNRAAYIEEQVRGIEFNPDIAQAAMIRLAFEGGSGSEVLCANALGPLESMRGSFDVVLTNPPFGSRGKIEDPRILGLFDLAFKWVRDTECGWKATKNVSPAQTPEILFLERSMELLRPGGRMGIVLPDGLLQNTTVRYVRTWLRSRAEVLAVVSIPQDAFVPFGTGIKTSVLFLRKLPATRRSHCFMARVQRVGYDVKGQPTYRRDDAGRAVLDRHGVPIVDDDLDDIASAYSNFTKAEHFASSDDIFAVPSASLNSRLDVEHYLPSDMLLVERLRSLGAKRLGDLVEIVAAGDDFRLVGEEEIRYIAISDVDARTMQVVAQQTMRAHEAPSRATYRVRTGDIITAISGASTGTRKHATALITEDENGAICSNGFAVLRNVREVDSLYLLAYLRTEPFLRQVRRLMTGHAIPAISVEDLSDVLVPVPAENRQVEISLSVRQLLALRREALRMGEQVIAHAEGILNA